jgi:hypothetical protein
MNVFSSCFLLFAWEIICSISFKTATKNFKLKTYFISAILQ